MFRKMLIRFMTTLAFCLPLCFAAAAVSQANEEPPAGEGECQGCHEIVHTHWAESGHGQATENPVFQEALSEAAAPQECLACHTTGFDSVAGSWSEDGVSCSTCHGPEPSNHPEQIMPTDVSSRLCGSCHLETYSDWTDSVHAQEDLACVRCHSPHTTTLKSEDAQALCSTCHSEEVHFYSYTSHYEAGLLCTDCHLRVAETVVGEGHGQRSHSFAVDMATCSECHEDEMHYPFPRISDSGDGPPASMITIGSGVEPSNEPNPVSPAGYAVLAALLGTAFGIVLAPWSEKIYRRLQ